MAISINKNKVGINNYVVIEKDSNGNIIDQHRVKNKKVALKIKSQIIKSNREEKRILGNRC
jgi:hypothetical protein